MPYRPRKYELLEDGRDHYVSMSYTGIANSVPVVVGLVVYECLKADYGHANDDTRMTGEEYMSVTLNPEGDYPFITMPKRILKQVT